jgi:predicted alpha/beta superfamily hydrolase
MRGPLLLAALAWAASAVGAAEPPATPPVPPHESFTIASARVAETRTITVYLPPGYATAEGRRYPVLYMPDGGLAEDFPHVAGDVDAAIRDGGMRPMIVVGIENTERRRDMTGPTGVESDRKIAPRVGGSAAFRGFLADELVPEVRRRYRTDGRSAIIGESLAGLFVLETFFLQPQLFDTYVALSPSLWWNDGALLRSAPAILDRWQPALRRTLWVATAGDDDIDGAGQRLQAVLAAHAPAGLAWRYVPRPDLHHADIYRRASPAILRELFPPEGASMR